ncbi:hypothetical protein ABVK25_004277 [Lepraria finkii]|uniref:Uncharacterized protein n=1 Tax=Lepraria finkii TaxID=1340010 RepID=A0ABR4BCA2_9LECA
MVWFSPSLKSTKILKPKSSPRLARSNFASNLRPLKWFTGLRLHLDRVIQLEHARRWINLESIGPVTYLQSTGVMAASTTLHPGNVVASLYSPLKERSERNSTLPSTDIHDHEGAR